MNLSKNNQHFISALELKALEYVRWNLATGPSSWNCYCLEWFIIVITSWNVHHNQQQIYTYIYILNKYIHNNSNSWYAYVFSHVLLKSQTSLNRCIQNNSRTNKDFEYGGIKKQYQDVKNWQKHTHTNLAEKPPLGKVLKYTTNITFLDFYTHLLQYRWLGLSKGK